MRYFYGLKNKLMSFFRWNSLWAIISLTTALLIAFAVIMITLLINDRYNNVIDYSAQQNNGQIVDSVASSIDRYLKDMIFISDFTADIITDNNSFNSMGLNFFLRLWKEDVNTIAVFDINANVVAKVHSKTIKAGNELSNQEWFQAIAAENKDLNFTNPHVQRLYDGEYPWVISLSKEIAQNGYEKKIALIDFNFNKIKELCSTELGKSGYIYILGPGDKVVYHPRQQMIYAGIVQSDIPMVAKLYDGNTILESNGERVSVSIRTLENAEWRIIGVSPLRGFFSYDSDIFNFTNIIICVTILLVVILVTLVSLFITRPIRKLMDMMRFVEVGKFDTVYQIQGVYEVTELSHSFNHMVSRIKQLMDELHAEQETIKKDQAQLLKSEMKVLQAQFSPHFLYNTLDSVVWLAEAGDNKNVIKMIGALGTFFRLTLSGGAEMIPVENELKLAENYLIIQEMRYSEQFDYRVYSEMNLSGYLTLKNIIQPIVENSIVHGVSNMLEQCHISVRAYADNNRLIIEIKDNGCGIEQSMIEKILVAQTSSKSGVGVRNVHNRIRLMFGADYGLKYESELDVGTTVIITLPLITEQKRSDDNEKNN